MRVSISSAELRRKRIRRRRTPRVRQQKQERLAAEKAKADAEAARQAALQQQQLLAKASARMRDRGPSERGTGQGTAAPASAAAVQHDPRDSRHGSGADREYVGRSVRYGEVHAAAAAREKLARVSGIILSHPGLRIEVEGHTDSVGSDAYNQRLSEQRAESVRDYLLSQGLKGISLPPKASAKRCPWRLTIPRPDGSRIAASNSLCRAK